MSDMRIKPVFAWYQGSEAPVFERLKSRQVNPLFLGWTKMLPEGTTAKEMWAACPEGSWLLEYARECGYHHDEHGRAKLVEAACACSKLAVRHVFKDDLAAHKMIDSLDRLCQHLTHYNWESGQKEKTEEIEKAIKQQVDALRELLSDSQSDGKHAIDALVAAAETAKAALEAIEVTGMGNVNVIGWKTWFLSWQAVVAAEKVGSMKQECANVIRNIIAYTSLAPLT